MTTERAAEIVFVGGPERCLTLQQVLDYASRCTSDRQKWLDRAPAYEVAREISRILLAQD